MPMKEFDCEDHGASFRSPSEDELIRAYQYHSEKYHMQNISEEDARRSLKNVEE